jgi:hypothetical protein
MLQDIALDVYNKIISQCNNSILLQDILESGNKYLKEQCTLHNCSVLYPVVISLDNVMYHGLASGKLTEKSVLKIDFAINKDDSIYFLGETYSKNPEDKEVLKFLNTIQTKLVKKFEKKAFPTNDEVSLYIQRKCIENKYNLIENCKSYQYMDKLLYSDDSKYIICNYTKYYTDDDFLYQANDCEDLESGEIYVINITVYKDTEDIVKYKIDEEPHLAFFNNQVYMLKLKSSREFYSRTKTANSNNVFYCYKYNSISDKIGKKECIKNNILEPLYSETCNQVTYSKKFVVKIP